MINRANINSLTASLMIEELVRLGVTQFVVSPGSRSTPLALAAANHKTAYVTVHVDERGASFFALGQGMGSGMPSVLICTSGTAAVNYHPAVVEASMSSIPMIVLTADRPERLRGTGANQTINQVELYGDSPRLFEDIESPSANSSLVRLIESIDKAFRACLSPDPGPVHLNCMFDEPLAPIDDGNDYDELLRPLESWIESGKPYTDTPQDRQPDSDTVDRIAQLLTSSKSGVILIGRLPAFQPNDNIIRLANQIGWPVLSDICSQLRLTGTFNERIDYYDQILQTDPDLMGLKAETVLHLGGPLVSKRLLSWLKKLQPNNYVQVKQGRLPFDPESLVTDRIDTSPDTLAGSLVEQLKPRDARALPAKLNRADETIDNLLSVRLTNRVPLTETYAARVVSQELPEGHALFLANSMTVRQLDQFGRPGRGATPVGCNRGASGIDGTLATAAGMADQLRQPLTCVLGDLAMLHDLNSLPLIRNCSQPVTVVILNNNGGRIFEQLPIAEFKNQFEKMFVTPTGLGFEYAAQMFGINYFRCESASQFFERYRTASSFPRSTILELSIIPEMSRAEREKIRLALAQALAEQVD